MYKNVCLGAAVLNDNSLGYGFTFCIHKTIFVQFIRLYLAVSTLVFLKMHVIEPKFVKRLIKRGQSAEHQKHLKLLHLEIQHFIAIYNLIYTTSRTLGDKSFSAAAPRLWNSLPVTHPPVFKHHIFLKESPKNSSVSMWLIVFFADLNTTIQHADGEFCI